MAGAARLDITPQLGVPLAGYGTGVAKERARSPQGRLFANVLVIADANGSQVALVSADLHAGFRYLVEQAAALLAERGVKGLTVDRTPKEYEGQAYEGASTLFGHQAGRWLTERF